MILGMSESKQRRVTLRSERRAKNTYSLWAYIDANGNLHVDGQDLGPVTEPVSGDGEYEYFKTIAAADVPLLLGLLGAPPNSDVLDVLASFWSDSASWELERLLRASDIPMNIDTYGS
jgi:hypothetical protein